MFIALKYQQTSHNTTTEQHRAFTKSQWTDTGWAGWDPG